jgi:UDP-glucose 4-epimerase
VFVGDVVAANLLLSDAALPPPATLDARAFNVGTGKETSVVELAEALMTVSGRKVAREHAPARPGELEHSCLDATRLRGLGWQPRGTLAAGLGQTFRHIAGEVGA